MRDVFLDVLRVVLREVLRAAVLAFRPFFAAFRPFLAAFRFGAGGTFPPAARASDRPIAIACLRLFTFAPEPPERSVPCLRSCIAFSTLAEAFGP